MLACWLALLIWAARATTSSQRTWALARRFRAAGWIVFALHFPAAAYHPASAPTPAPSPSHPGPIPAAHGTNVDGAWIRANVPKQLNKGSVLKFGASSREYTVSKLPNPVLGR